MTKLHRFHIDVYCPEWARESLLNFSNMLKGYKLVCSYHATRKYKLLSRTYKKAVKTLLENLDISDEMNLDYVFEFYADNNNFIKKVCYRFPQTEVESDIILVISSTGKVVTMFLNRNFDPQISLNKELYEKGNIN